MKIFHSLSSLGRLKKLNLKNPATIAFSLALALLAWMLSGQLVGETTQTSTVGTSAPSLTGDRTGSVLSKVRVNKHTAAVHTRQLILHGRTEIGRWVDIKAETQGKVTSVIAQEGDRLASNELIIQLAMDSRMEILSRAEALLRQRQLEFDAATTLSKKGFRAETNLARAAAQLETAKADVASIKVEIQHTSIRAPFDSVMEIRYVEVGDFVQAGSNIARVIDEDSYLVVGQISEMDIDLVDIGDSAVAKLSSGFSIPGNITFISRVADDATRTFRVELAISNKDRLIRSGMTADIHIPVQSAPAQFVSPALLTLDDEGVMGVRTVSKDARVVFKPITIFATEPDGIWILGLPERIDIITVGQEFVVNGEHVLPIHESFEEKE